MSANVFGSTEPSVPRHGRDGRPKILLPDHAPNAELARKLIDGKQVAQGVAAYYTRTSTLAKAFDSGDGLANWKAAMVLLGASRSDSIVKAARLLTDWKQAGELVEDALTLAGASDAARDGTTLHELTERVDMGGDVPQALDDATVRAVSLYRRVTEGLEPLAAETFVVNDLVRSAGTFDRLYRVTGASWPEWLRGKVVVGDLKTGSYYPQSCAIQIGTYATGSLYDPLDGTRTPLGADPTVGLVIHLPRDGSAATVHALDLTAGMRAAELARVVKDWNTAATRDAISTVVRTVAA